MSTVKRKLPFVLAASDHGTMIVSRLDYHMVSKTSGFGVGFQILESGAFDSDISTTAFLRLTVTEATIHCLEGRIRQARQVPRLQHLRLVLKAGDRVVDPLQRGGRPAGRSDQSGPPRCSCSPFPGC